MPSITEIVLSRRKPAPISGKSFSFVCKASLSNPQPEIFAALGKDESKLYDPENDR